MPKIKVDIEEIKSLLPTTDNVTLAQKYGVSRERIRQLRFLLARDSVVPRKRRTSTSAISESEAFISALGTAADGEVARQFSVSLSVVAYARKQRNIPSYAETRLAEVVPLLKTHSDEFLMERYGYSLAGVRQLRKQHNAPFDGAEPPRKRRKKAVTEQVVVQAAVTAHPLIETGVATMLNDVATLEFLRRRHKAGDSAESLAARLEVSVDQVRAALGL